MKRKWFKVPKSETSKDLRQMLGRLYSFKTTKGGVMMFRRKTPEARKAAERASWTEVWSGGGGALKGTRHRLMIVKEKAKPKNRGFEWLIKHRNGEYTLNKRWKRKGRV